MAATQFDLPLVGEEADDPRVNILSPESRSFQVEAGVTEARGQAHKANGRIKFALALAAVGLLVCAGAFSLDRSATKGVRGTSAIQQLSAKDAKDDKDDKAPAPATRPKDDKEDKEDKDGKEAGKKEVDPYVVVAVYSGKMERMRLLLPYLNRLRDDGKIQDIHIWDFADYEKDRAWMMTTAWKNGYKIQNFRGGKALGSVYNYYATFQRPKGAADGPVVILKVDDDIVYIDTEAFGDFTRFTAYHPEMLVVHANVVNNGVAAYYQFHQPALKSSSLAAPLGVYPKDPEEGVGGALTKPNALVAQLHELFLKEPKAFRWGDSDSCVQFHAPDSTIEGQGRFPINFYAARQEAWVTLAKFVSSGDEEAAVTTVATANKNKECMFTSFNAVLMSSDLQFQANVYGPMYQQLLEKQGLHALPGLEENDPCADPEGARSVAKEGLRAGHDGDDLPNSPVKGIPVKDCKTLCNAAAACKGIEFFFNVETAFAECHLKADATANIVGDPFRCLWVKPTSHE